MSEDTILYDSEDAASFTKGISGWVSRDGRFWGNAEDLARYAGCTHKRCECGNIMEKTWLKCAECRERKAADKYLSMPERIWKGEPLVSYRGDNYLWSDDEVYDFLHEFDGEDPQLVICEPIFAPLIEEYGIDHLPEGWVIDDADVQLAKLINNVNQYILEYKPILSWTEGKYRTTVRLPESTD